MDYLKKDVAQNSELKYKNEQFEIKNEKLHKAKRHIENKKKENKNKMEVQKMECDDFGGAFSDIDSDEDEKVVAEFKHGKYFK